MRTIAGQKEDYLFGRIMYVVGYLMWVMEVGEPWCAVIGPKEGCHTIGPYCITLTTSPTVE